MILFTGEWTGSSIESELKNGAVYLMSLLRTLNPSQNPFDLSKSVNESYAEKIQSDKITNFNLYFRKINEINKLLTAKHPSKILHIGGGCALDIPVISFLKKKYRNMKVIWFDAHGDLNTPETSNSGYFHGMALGMLTATNIISSSAVINSKNIHLSFIKELDDSESIFIKNNNISVSENFKEIIGYISSLDSRIPVYIHIDFDVFHPDDVLNIKCRQKTGVKINEMIEIINVLNIKNNISGISLLENVDTGNSKFKEFLKNVLDIPGL